MARALEPNSGYKLGKNDERKKWLASGKIGEFCSDSKS
jgi:hypothetical protein